MLFVLGFRNLTEDNSVIYELSSHMNSCDALISAYQCLLSQPYQYTTIKSSKEDIEKIFKQGVSALRLCVDKNNIVGEFWIVKR